MSEPEVEQATEISNTPDVAIVELCKTYLADPTYRIKLHDLLMSETGRLYAAAFPSSNTLTSLPAQELADRLAFYRDLMQPLLSCFVLGGRWAGPDTVRSFSEALEWIATPPNPTGQHTEAGKQLQYYPALLLFYAAGIGALASQNWELLATLIADPQISTQFDADMPLIEIVNTASVMDIQVAQLLPGRERRRTPVSGIVEEDLREPLRYLFWNERRYVCFFDLFEYLVSVLYGDIRIKREECMWVPMGNYVWRTTNQSALPTNILDTIVRQAPPDWPPFQKGLFGGSYEGFTAITTQVASFFASARW